MVTRKWKRIFPSSTRKTLEDFGSEGSISKVGISSFCPSRSLLRLSNLVYRVMFDIDIRIFVLILEPIKFIISALMSLSKLTFRRDWILEFSSKCDTRNFNIVYVIILTIKKLK